MVAPKSKYARLNKDGITKLQELEKELGKIVIAYENESVYADLNQDQLRRMQELEKELGVTLIAYKPGL